MCLCIRGPGLILDHSDERHQMWNKIKVSERQPVHWWWQQLSAWTPCGSGIRAVPPSDPSALFRRVKGSLSAGWGLVPRGYSGQGPLLSILSHLSCLVWYSAWSTKHLWWPSCHHLDVLTLNSLQYHVPRWHVRMWSLSNSLPCKKVSRHCWTFSSVPPPLQCYLRC